MHIGFGVGAQPDTGSLTNGNINVSSSHSLHATIRPLRPFVEQPTALSDQQQPHMQPAFIHAYKNHHIPHGGCSVSQMSSRPTADRTGSSIISTSFAGGPVTRTMLGLLTGQAVRRRPNGASATSTQYAQGPVPGWDNTVKMDADVDAAPAAPPYTLNTSRGDDYLRARAAALDPRGPPRPRTWAPKARRMAQAMYAPQFVQPTSSSVTLLPTGWMDRSCGNNPQSDKPLSDKPLPGALCPFPVQHVLQRSLPGSEPQDAAAQPMASQDTQNAAYVVAADAVGITSDAAANTATNAAPIVPVSNGTTATGAASAPIAGLDGTVQATDSLRRTTERSLVAVPSFLATPPSGKAVPVQTGQQPLPAPVTVQVASRSRRSNDRSGGKSRVTRGVVGVFHPELYLTGGDCIECDEEMMSRGRFERLAGTATAKWHVSIKVLPSGMTLGKWLQQHGLPVLQGRPRKRRASTDEDKVEQADDEHSGCLPSLQPCPEDPLVAPKPHFVAAAAAPMASASTAATASHSNQQGSAPTMPARPSGGEPGDADDNIFALLETSGILDDICYSSPARGAHQRWPPARRLPEDGPATTTVGAPLPRGLEGPGGLGGGGCATAPEELASRARNDSGAFCSVAAALDAYAARTGAVFRSSDCGVGMVSGGLNDPVNASSCLLAHGQGALPGDRGVPARLSGASSSIIPMSCSGASSNLIPAFGSGASNSNQPTFGSNISTAPSYPYASTDGSGIGYGNGLQWDAPMNHCSSGAAAHGYGSGYADTQGPVHAGDSGGCHAVCRALACAASMYSEALNRHSSTPLDLLNPALPLARMNVDARMNNDALSPVQEPDVMRHNPPAGASREAITTQNQPWSRSGGVICPEQAANCTGSGRAVAQRQLMPMPAGRRLLGGAISNTVAPLGSRNGCHSSAVVKEEQQYGETYQWSPHTQQVPPRQSHAGGQQRPELWQQQGQQYQDQQLQRTSEHGHQQEEQWQMHVLPAADARAPEPSPMRVMGDPARNSSVLQVMANRQQAPPPGMPTAMQMWGYQSWWQQQQQQPQ